VIYPMPLWGEDEAFVEPPTWGKLPFRGVPPRDINAWMWDGDPLDLGSFGGKIKRARLEDPAKIEALRWRILCYMEDKIRPAWKTAIRAIHESAHRVGIYVPTKEDYGRFARHDDGDFIRITAFVARDSIHYAWCDDDPTVHPLRALARVGAERGPLALGAEWIRVEKWRCDWMRKLIKVESALMTALWYQQNKLNEVGKRVVFTLNGRRYPSDNFLQEVFPSAWPTPDQEEVVL
jgi:hypothetical protein